MPAFPPVEYWITWQVFVSVAPGIIGIALAVYAMRDLPVRRFLLVAALLAFTVLSIWSSADDQQRIAEADGSDSYLTIGAAIPDFNDLKGPYLLSIMNPDAMTARNVRLRIIKLSKDPDEMRRDFLGATDINVGDVKGPNGLIGLRQALSLGSYEIDISTARSEFSERLNLANADGQVRQSITITKNGESKPLLVAP